MPWFKLLAGKHTEGKDERGTSIVYKKGDVFESKHDLAKMLNREGAMKFELVDAPRRAQTAASGDMPANAQAQRQTEGQQGTQPNQPPTGQPPANAAQAQTAPKTNLAEYQAQLERMNIKELQEHAREEEVDLKGATKKEDMIRILRGAQA